MSFIRKILRGYGLCALHTQTRRRAHVLVWRVQCSCGRTWHEED